jgi:hypothetical protein
VKQRAKDELRDLGTEIGKQAAKTLLERFREWWRYDRPRAKNKRPTEHCPRCNKLVQSYPCRFCEIPQ